MSNHQPELFFGLIRIHVLVHASHEPIFGLAMMEELAHHGYRIGPGTLYPLLHGLERSGLLKSALKNVGGRSAAGLQDHLHREEGFSQGQSEGRRTARRTS